ncbi:MAG: hypothetical protein ACD_75C02632G0002 [uncultured bacterium]|nr:MAG: hypothetical protein ACD_75C02632G0002 [uncultured bacterium]
MGGDEILEHPKTLTEVGLDRCFDDRATRLGHETAHTGQLANLIPRTSRSGIGHNENGIKTWAFNSFTVFVKKVVDLDLIHHGVGHIFRNL